MITWFEGSRALLRPLFELADDSSAQIDSSIELGQLLVAAAESGEILGHAQLLRVSPATTELKSIAVRELDRA